MSLADPLGVALLLLLPVPLAGQSLAARLAAAGEGPST